MTTAKRKKPLTKKSSAATKDRLKTSVTEEKLYNCPFCNKDKPSSGFYISTDPKVLSGITRICKECASDIARRKDPHGNYHEETKKSVQEALEYLDKPYIESLWNSSYFEIHNPSNHDKSSNSKKSLWGAYIKNVSMSQYQGLRWRDSDIFKNNVHVSKSNKPLSEDEESKNKEIYENAEINKKDVIRMIGYNPFASYPSPEELPILYAKLVGLLDEDTSNDGMKLNAVIQIVKIFAQVEKINDAIDLNAIDTTSVMQNSGVIKALSETVQKLIKTANELAKDNGISVNFNNNKSKGANTLTGKMKKLKEIGFRDAKINTFDIGSCEGMRQVAEISEAARHKQIGYDENIAQEIKDIKVELVEKLTRERDEALERSRLLLVENNDLKDFLKEKRLVNENMEVII